MHCRPTLLISAILIESILSTSYAEDGIHAKWNLRDHIPLSEVVVQSHRGAGTLSPENSLEAFEIAWKLRTIPEADLRTTNDGVIVAFHDQNFERILPSSPKELRSKGIEHLSSVEVARLDIGEWKGPEYAGQRVPTLAKMIETLAAHPERKLYIDIKNVDLEQLSRETKQVHAQLILASTDYSLIRRWMKLAPNSATLHWMGGTEKQLTERLAKLREADFADIAQLQVHVRILDNGNFTPSEKFLARTGDELRRHRILFQALPWESKDPQVFWRLMDLGVASFATDFPEVTMKAVGDYYQQRSKTPRP